MHAVLAREGACWRCDDRIGLSPACGTCHAPQPIGPDFDHYGVLGLERSLVVDAADLQRRYHELARTLHPDRHQLADARSTELSVQATAALNRAHRTLHDPIARGRYWLELHGIALAKDNNRVPPGLAALVFDVQEQLEELGAAPGSAGVRAGVETARAEVKRRLESEVAGLEACYARWGTSTDEASLGELKRRLTEIAYLKTLLADVEDALED
jgi:molecular chaperone HscB